jgi:hypothetical protein
LSRAIYNIRKKDNIFSMNRQKTIGELLKQVHIDKINKYGPKYTQAELARWIGISPVIFNKYYNDERSPSDESLKIIADKIGPIVYLTIGRIPPELEEIISKAPVDKLDDLKKLIEDFLTSEVGAD